MLDGREVDWGSTRLALLSVRWALHQLHQNEIKLVMCWCLLPWACCRSRRGDRWCCFPCGIYCSPRQHWHQRDCQNVSTWGRWKRRSSPLDVFLDVGGLVLLGVWWYNSLRGEHLLYGHLLVEVDGSLEETPLVSDERIGFGAGSVLVWKMVSECVSLRSVFSPHSCFQNWYPSPL